MVEMILKYNSCFSFQLLLIYSSFSFTHMSYKRKIPIFSTEKFNILFIEV